MSAGSSFQVGNVAMSVVRMMLLRGSPERILYSRKLFIASLLSALLLSGLAQWLFHGDRPEFVILRVFAETTMFMVWIVLLTAKVARLRLASMMLSLVLMSALIDALLALLGLVLPVGVRVFVSAAAGAVLLYGGASVLAWALRKELLYGGMHVAGYAIAVYALDASFRHLFGMMVS